VSRGKRYDHATAESAGLPPTSVRIQLHNWRDPGDDAGAFAVLSPSEAMSLVHNVLAQLDPAGLARHVQAGDCPTCKNTRLVDTPPAPGHKHGSNMRCPVCGPDFDRTPFVWPSNTVQP
jgi:hypothetical protein